MIATVIPTRGLLFAETIRSLLRNGITAPMIISGKPIPDAYNEGVEKARSEHASHILFVEDDMQLPDRCVQKMLEMEQPIVALDYPVDNGCSTVCRSDGEVLWCGLGCILIDMRVFEALEKPWFTTQHSYQIIGEEPFEVEKRENRSKYGGHDINFCMEARGCGFSITIYPEPAKHLRCKELTRGTTNASTYTITALEKTMEQNYKTSI